MLAFLQDSDCMEKRKKSSSPPHVHRIKENIHKNIKKEGKKKKNFFYFPLWLLFFFVVCFK